MASKKNSAHGSVERRVHERQTMLRIGGISFFPVFWCRWASVPPYLQSGLAPFPFLSPRTRHSRQGNPRGAGSAPRCQRETRPPHPSCPCDMQNTLRQPHRWHHAAAAPLHSLPRRNACAMAPPSLLKQSTGHSQPLQTIKCAQRKTEAQLAPLCHSPFLKPLASTFRLLLWSIPKARAVPSVSAGGWNSLANVVSTTSSTWVRG